MKIRKPDFVGINRVMAPRRAALGMHRSPLLRSMHMDDSGGGTAVLEAPTVEIPGNELPTSKEALGEFVKKSASAIQQLSSYTGVNAGAVNKLSVDLKAAVESAKAAEKRIAAVEEMARNATRSVPGAALSLEALRTIPCNREVDDDFKGKMGRGQYNVLMLSRQEMEMLDEPVAKFVHRFRLIHDTLAIVDAYFTGLGAQRARDYFERGGLKGLKLWGQFENASKQLTAAMDTATAGEGLEWAPRGVGVSLIEDIRPDLELVSMIETIPMPRSPYLYPVQGTHFKANKVPQATADSANTAINKKNLSTINLNFDAVKLAAMVLTSSELEEDSIVPLVSAIRADLAFAEAAALEDVWDNGQVTSVIDTGAVPAADDCKASWDGLRWAAQQVGATVDFGAGLIVEGLTVMKGKMGKFGKSARDGFWVTSYAGWAKLLTLKDSSGTSLVLTQEKFGANATLNTGVMGMLLGSPVIVPDDHPQNQNAAGIIDAVTTDRTSILYANRRGMRHGEVRLSLIEASRDWAFDVDQIAFRVTYRASGKFVRTPSAIGTASPWAVVSQGVNIPTN